MKGHQGEWREASWQGLVRAKAWRQAATPSNAQAGFRGSGIFPFNLDKIKKIIFMPSETAERPFESAGATPSHPLCDDNNGDDDDGDSYLQEMFNLPEHTHPPTQPRSAWCRSASNLSSSTISTAPSSVHNCYPTTSGIGSWSGDTARGSSIHHCYPTTSGTGSWSDETARDLLQINDRMAVITSSQRTANYQPPEGKASFKWSDQWWPLFFH